MMISLKDANTVGPTHMNKTHMWKTTEAKGLIEKANEVEAKREKHVRQKKLNSRVLEVTDLKSNETNFFQV